ncbi:MAG: hypothetical protein OXB84_02755 [Halobacteriovoraceae bacterium]|nr:hypothetical protein [Halobacteriovoraceae bacterium]
MTKFFLRGEKFSCFFLFILCSLVSCSADDPAPTAKKKEKKEISPGPPFSPNSPFNNPDQDPADQDTAPASRVYYGSELQQISVGFDHACLLFNDKKLTCWGNNASRQLGKMGETDDTAQARIAAPSADNLIVESYDSEDNDGPVYLKNVIQVSAGKNSTCALLDTSKVKCWGSGQLGFGENATNQELPRYVHKASGNANPLENIIKIVSGEEYYCALTRAGTVKCWGEGSLGQLGNGAKEDTSSPVNVMQSSNVQLRGVVNIAAGINHTCAIMADSKLKCWGKGFNGKLGNGITEDTSYPVYALKGSEDSCANDNSSHLTRVIQVALSGNSTCALLSNQQVSCWGKGSNGQLGNKVTVSDDYTNKCALANVLADEESYLDNVKKIVAGSNHFCALLQNSQVKCWGEGANGKLGHGSEDDSTIAASTGALTKVRQLAAGYEQVCVTKRVDSSSNGNSRDLDCWGGLNDVVSPTQVLSDLHPYNVQYYCNSSASCKINPASNFALYLVSDGSDHSVQILNLNESNHVTVHPDNSCSRSKITEGTVSTEKTSLNLNLPTSNLEPNRYHYYAKVGSLCSIQFATLIIE